MVYKVMKVKVFVQRRSHHAGPYMYLPVSQALRVRDRVVGTYTDQL